MNNPWLVPFKSDANADHRLFCFPYAGGSAYVFRSWNQMLPPSFEVVAIQAPGTGKRLIEPPCMSVEEIVSGVLEAIGSLLGEKPFSFFGHSKGALIAFELAAKLQQRNMPQPKHLFLSASPAPWTRILRQDYASLSDSEFIERIKSLNGTPPGVFEEPELLKLLLPGLRADFTLCERYSHRPTDMLRVPTTVFFGEYDQIEPHQVRAWQDAIASEIRFESIPGEHFFIHSHLERLTMLVGRQLRRNSNLRGEIMTLPAMEFP